MTQDKYPLGAPTNRAPPPPPAQPKQIAPGIWQKPDGTMETRIAGNAAALPRPPVESVAVWSRRLYGRF